MTKTVFVAGSNKGLGLGFVKHYMNQGCNVIATARNVEQAHDLKALNPWKVLTLDTSNEESILAAAKEVEGVPIDILINNAGIGLQTTLEEGTKEQIMQQFEVNAVGPFLMTRALLSNLKLAVKEHGFAIASHVTSRMGSIEDNDSGSHYGYRASKTALNMINKSLSVDLKDEKISCILLHPGFVRTDITNGNGLVDVPESVEGMTSILDKATMENTGKYYHFKGEELPW